MSSSANKHRRDERPASFAATTSFVQIALRIPALRLTAFCRQEARCRHASRAASLHTRNRMAIDRLPTMTADRREPPPTPSFAVLYSDSRYIAVYKPPDVRIDGPLTPTVQTFAAETLAARPPSPDALNPRRTTPGQAPTPKIHNVHRLDYATSGVMLVALTRPAAAIAAHQFQTRAVQKTYTGIVHGTLASPITATASIAPTEAFRMAAHPSGRSATTRIVPVRPGVYRGAPVTLVRFHPVEGRRHQIRVHASSLFYPIVGDATYAEDEEAKFDEPFCPPRMMLHAASLRISLPPKDAVVHGWKSGLNLVEEMTFAADDPFVEEMLPGLEWT